MRRPLIDLRSADVAALDSFDQGTRVRAMSAGASSRGPCPAFGQASSWGNSSCRPGLLGRSASSGNSSSCRPGFGPAASAPAPMARMGTALPGSLPVQPVQDDVRRRPNRMKSRAAQRALRTSMRHAVSNVSWLHSPGSRTHLITFAFPDIDVDQIIVPPPG